MFRALYITQTLLSGSIPRRCMSIMNKVRAQRAVLDKKQKEITDQAQYDFFTKVKTGKPLSNILPEFAPDPMTKPPDAPATKQQAFPSPAYEMNDRGEPLHPRGLRIAIIGAPNAGKSTLINDLVGSKVSIVSPKVQTTRERVCGVLTVADSQLEFYDTPGIGPKGYHPQQLRPLTDVAWSTAEDADQVMMVIDAARRINHQVLDLVKEVVERTKEEHMDEETENQLMSEVTALESKSAPILVLNKVDLVKPKSLLLPLVTKLNEQGKFARTFLVSALERDGTDELRSFLLSKAVPREWEYERYTVTDQTDLKRTEEIIREKLYARLNKELPYQLQQRTDSWKVFRDGSVRIDHTIIVGAKSHKPIVIGARGQVLKAIGTAARLELESMLKRRVHLILNVVVGK